MSDATLGYCGLYCAACGIYQATSAGAPRVDENGVALACDGCNSERLTPWCAACAIKICARARGLRVCGECPENPCAMLLGFTNDPRYPYHRAIQGDMRLLAAKGLVEFERVITDRYTCASCGVRLDWLAKICPACGKPVEIAENK